MTTPAVTKVRDLEFSDIYLGHPHLEDRISDVPGAATNPLIAGPALQEDLQQLAKSCAAVLSAAPSVLDFKLVYDDVSYRVAVMPTLGGNLFVVRKIVASIASLAELGIPQAYIRRMMSEEMTGLFIVAGSAKSGKTMTACALLKERLKTYGGVAVTSEDLMELPLEGSHGPGVCYQTPGSGDPAQFIESFRRLIGWGRRIILIDEVRDQHVAVELLKASVGGHLIITTMTAESVIQAISRLHALTNSALGAESARAMVADGLVGVLHQRRATALRGAGKLETELLILKDAPQTRTVLRKGEYELLASDIRQQMTAMIADNAAAQRMTVN